MSPVVQMIGVEKAFPGVQALKSANFDLEAGEVHALMGENGAGKSTLMKILAGIYQRNGGEILLKGKPVEIASPRAAQDLGIAIIHQELNLMPDLTAAENIFIGREPRRGFGFLDDRQLNANAKAIFDTMRLDLDPRTNVGGLTVAKQQMVEIAKSLSFQSRVLIMDEPTAALNDAEIADLFAIISRLKADGVGIVYISHKMDELKRIADRVTVMRDGTYVATVPMAETPVSKIIAMMVGRELADDATPQVPEEEGEVLLDVRHLNRGAAIRDVSFTVRRGEILGFAGLMGAGRTEVARAVFGADARDSGEIRVAGREVQIRTPSDAVRAGIGYLSEDRKQFGLATGMNVRDNVALASLSRFAGKAGFLDEGAMADTARGFIKTLAIKTPSDSQESRLLSGGNQQKVVIAKWLLRDCEILFFDEPTRGIDVGAKAEIYKLLNTLASEGRAIVVISSELPEVLRLSHRIAVMCEGRLTGFLPAGASQDAIMHLATLRGAQANQADTAIISGETP